MTKRYCLRLINLFSPMVVGILYAQRATGHFWCLPDVHNCFSIIFLCISL